MSLSSRYAKGITMKLLLIIFWVANCLIGFAQARSISFVYHQNGNAVTNTQSDLGHVSIGELKFSESDKSPAVWEEWFAITDTNLVLSLKMLMNSGFENDNVASLSGGFVEALFVDSKGIPQSHVGVSRANCYMSINDCRQDSSSRAIIHFVSSRTQVNSAWVGLVYGIILKSRYEIIHRNRLSFGSGDRSFDYFMFSPVASLDFWEAVKQQTNEIFGIKLNLSKDAEPQTTPTNEVINLWEP